VTETTYSQMIGLMVLERNSSNHKETLVIIEDIIKVLIVWKENLSLDAEHQSFASDLSSSKNSMLELVRKLVDRDHNNPYLDIYSKIYTEVLKYPNDVGVDRD